MSSDVILLKDKNFDNGNEEKLLRYSSENEVGNVEYKWKLINPDESRLQHLTTQMKWRLREGYGEALYRIGVEDDGRAVGLYDEDMEASLNTLFKMASLIGASVEVDKKIVGNLKHKNLRKIANVWIRKIPDDRNLVDLRLAFLGNAESGKSTLCGVLTQGVLDNGQGKSRLNIFRHLHEFRSGRTSSVCLEFIGFSATGKMINYKDHTLEEIIERATKIITLIDLGGDRRYLKTTIYGISGYNPHYCSLLVNAVTGITIVTKEHIGLTIALRIPLFIILIKIDLVNSSHCEKILKSIECLIKNLGKSLTPVRICVEEDVDIYALSMGQILTNNIVPILCVSNVTGAGIDLLSKFFAVLPQYNLQYLTNAWLKNETDKCLSINIDLSIAHRQSSLLFYVDELFLIEKVGIVLYGILEMGVIHEAENIQVGPTKSGAYLKGIVESIHRNKQPVLKVNAGESASLRISFQGKESLNICLNDDMRKGMVVLGEHDIGVFCQRFRAKFYLLYHSAKSKELSVGFRGTVYIGSLCRSVIIIDVEGTKSIRINKWVMVKFKFVKQVEYVHIGKPIIFCEHGIKAMGEVVEVFKEN